MADMKESVPLDAHHWCARHTSGGHRPDPLWGRLPAERSQGTALAAATAASSEPEPPPFQTGAKNKPVMLKVGESCVQTKGTQAQKPGGLLLFLSHSLPFLGCARSGPGLPSVRPVGQTIEQRLPGVAAAGVEGGRPPRHAVRVPHEQGSCAAETGGSERGKPPRWRTTHRVCIQLEDLRAEHLHRDRPVFKYTLSCFTEHNSGFFHLPVIHV